jgi:hypothetical protein
VPPLRSATLPASARVRGSHWEPIRGGAVQCGSAIGERDLGERFYGAWRFCLERSDAMKPFWRQCARRAPPFCARSSSAALR